jgi:serine/threonine protein kinase
MNDSMPGDEWVFAGRYRVDAPIGSGGMGAVWSGYDQQLDRRVAIKLMHPVTAPAVRAGSAEAEALAEETALARERFLREIRTTARLELPGIPAVYDFGVEESTGRIFLVMQLLYGQSLADLIAAREPHDPWPVSWAAAVVAQVAATLVDVHAVDVVHRDIKPSNLMVGASGLVKVLDFGVAILRGASALPKLTRIGMTVGSPAYLPPEQVLGNPVGPASDVYALGCVLHEIVTGRVPFVETAARSYQDHHVNTPAAAVRTLRPDLDLPAELDQLVLAMLAKPPGDRPSAEAVYDALLPLARSGPAAPAEQRDPRRPFLRPLAPTSRPRAATPTTRAPAPGQPPLTVEEALDIHECVAQLVRDAQLQQAIDLLDAAVARAAHDPALRRELTIELAETLFIADEFTRAVAAFDAVLPELDKGEDSAILWYHAGVSHAETGDIEPAIGYLTTFLEDADPADPLYRDALFQLGIMLPVIGRVEDGLRHLNQLRPILVAEYGPESIHVTSLDRRIQQLRRRHS